MSAYKAPNVLIGQWQCLESTQCTWRGLKVPGKNTCCACYFMAMLGKHPLCLEMTMSPWKTLVVLASLWQCLESTPYVKR